MKNNQISLQNNQICSKNPFSKIRDIDAYIQRSSHSEVIVDTWILMDTYTSTYIHLFGSKVLAAGRKVATQNERLRLTSTTEGRFFGGRLKLSVLGWLGLAWLAES